MGRSAGRAGQSRGSGRTAGATARRSGHSTRRTGHARPARGRRRRNEPRIGWSRRLGIAAALLLLGGSVVFAGQALQPPGPPTDARPTVPSGSPAASLPLAPSPTDTAPAVLPAAPLLVAPAATLVTDEEVELRGELAEELPRDGRYRLRIYINGELVRDRRLPRRESFRLPSVPLAEGSNSIALAVSGPAGESLHSAPIVIVRDNTAPEIVVLEPAPGPIYAEAAALRGTSEPGATLTVTNATNGAVSSLVVGPDGLFELGMALARGPNVLELHARDEAGNTSRASLALERREGSTSVSLYLSRETISLSSLPATLTLRARVLDPAGQPLDGAEVTFSISPPGLPTQTHVGTSSGGAVTWSGVRISREAQAGQGLVTVLVVLPGGQTLQESAFFTIE